MCQTLWSQGRTGVLLAQVLIVVIPRNRLDAGSCLQGACLSPKVWSLERGLHQTAVAMGR